MVRFIARTLPGVKVAPFPAFIEPCKPTLKPKPPAGDKWQFEIKLDGYRTQLHLRGAKVTVFTSSGLDWSDRFATIADAAKDIPPSAVACAKPRSKRAPAATFLDDRLVLPDNVGRSSLM